MPGIALTASASAAAVQPEPSSGAVDDANVVAGVAAADQPGGTDSLPTMVASPTLADDAAPAKLPAPPMPMPPPENDPTIRPSVMPAPSAGTTSLTAMLGTLPSVCPRDTAVGMAFITNQAAVFTAPLMELPTAGVPMKPSYALNRSE